MEAVAAVKSVEDDEEDAWVVELEDALDFIGTFLLITIAIGVGIGIVFC